MSEICYPTGGSSVFEYELHDYAKVVNTKNRALITGQSGIASGLRIQKISMDNLNGNAVTETAWNRYGSQGEDNPTAFLFEGIKVAYDY